MYKINKLQGYIVQHREYGQHFITINVLWDFPGGAEVKNPPANEGDTGSSPGPGRSHMPRTN